MFQKKINLTIDIKLSNSYPLIHNVGKNTYNAIGYIKANVYLEDIKIDLPIKSLWSIVNNQNLLEVFRKTTNEHIETLRKCFLEKCEGKVLVNDDYYRDVNISYDEKDNTFCIIVCTKEGILDMERAWNSYLDNEWKKYNKKEHEVSFEQSKEEELEERC